MSECQKGSFDQFVEKRLSGTLRSDVASNSAVICSAGPGHPVVFVSDAFHAHTGYSLADVIGKNLAILQGDETEKEAVDKFRHLLRTGSSGTILITNYRKDNTRFLHECELRPIHDGEGNLTHFAAIQRPVELAVS